MRKPKVFLTTHRCTFLELDPYGHMNTVPYLTHFLNNRFHGMRDFIELDYKRITELPVFIVTRSVQLEFIRSVYADEEMEIRSWVDLWEETGCLVKAEMMKKEAGKLAATAEMTFRCVGRDTGRACAWPPELEALFFEP
jgi:YbgC/YbaW family acyl-CoA thioester hydrolase